ncbi:MAG: deferrochelatase/peroxidase EfeB, partial [Mycetocola sp.]
TLTDGEAVYAELNAGLFFIAYQRNPQTQFVAMQKHLAASDLLNEYIAHISSAIFAVPPGATEGSFIGHELFEATAP